ncbi:uncharacterized protein B0H18DRAFT_54230 [Fomitopsis serialis]|uniref:uncharacterized protein n=1 Tax=Fomitopsis serialis TaxID=139415 RepID=UPI002008979C|nr:uncharacterized protein B0H18DRAFT_54230 [Neoantrodia serialis]KAH9932357.1 hypothetical protein B0H18DRAFT_54230 [Neoantrodia serialis]
MHPCTQVYHQVETFDLRTGKDRFRLVFSLYNFVSALMEGSDHGRYKSMKDNLDAYTQIVNRNKFPVFTKKSMKHRANKRRRTDTGNDGGAVDGVLTARGYTIVTDWTQWRDNSSSSSEVRPASIHANVLSSR